MNSEQVSLESYLGEEDLGGKVLVVQEGDRPHVLNQVRVLRLHVHEPYPSTPTG